MSVMCIDLSSDEEIEIIAEQKKCSRPFVSENATSVENSKYSVSSAVERLKKNSNIEVIINLEQSNQDEEENMSEPKKANGASFEKLRELLTSNDHSENRLPHKNAIISSDVIVIDNDEKDEEQLEKDVILPSLKDKVKSELQTYSNSRCNSKTEKLQSSKVVVENGDEIYVIDDDDDECTVTSENSIAFNNFDNINNELKDPLEIDDSMVINQREELSQSSNNEKYENLKKITFSLAKSLQKSPPSKSNSPKTAGPSVPSISMSTPIRKQLPMAVVSLPSKLTIPIATPSNLLSGEPDDENSNEIVILSDETDQMKTTTRELRPRRRTEPEQDPLASKPSETYSSEKSSDSKSFTSSVQSCSKASFSKDNLLKKYGIDNVSQERINSYSVENMFDGLVKVSCKIFQDENLGTRLWRYFRAATENVLKSEEFLNALKLALKSSEDVKNPTFDDKLIVSRNLKEVMRILKRQPERDPLEIDDSMVINQREELSQSSNNEKYENLKKITFSLAKSLQKSPPSKSNSPKTAGPSVPSISMSTPIRKQLPMAVVSLPSKLTIPIATPSNLLSGEPDDENSNEIVILSDETDQMKTTTRELRPRRRTEPEQDPLASKPSETYSSEKSSDSKSFTSSVQSCSKASFSKDNLLKKYGIDNVSQERINSYSVENMFDGLVKVSCKIFQDENLGTRLWRYFRAATENVLKSEEFLNALKLALKSSEDVKNPTFDDKLIVSRNLKEVMRILKRQPERVNKTLRKLYKMLQIIQNRINKLEEMEVTSSSDEETENVYCLLDRHRARAAKIYSKICELEGKAAHAGRATLQKFHFSGTSGYSKIEHALEQYFNKTRLFPDFQDVKKLIEMTVEKEKLQIPPVEIHNIAQSVFLEFGNKLQRMRRCDDYTILVDYLDDGNNDPALDNEELFRKLQDNKKIRKKEEEVLADYTRKQTELKTKSEIKSDEVEADNDSEDNTSAKEDEEELSNKDLRFSDTEDELINEDVGSSSDRKRKLSTDNQLPLQPSKRSLSELDKMEVNLKLVTGVTETSINTRRRNSVDKDIVMDQLGLTKGKQKRI